MKGLIGQCAFSAQVFAFCLRPARRETRLRLFRPELDFIGDIAKVEAPEDAVEFRKVDVRNAGVAADDREEARFRLALQPTPRRPIPSKIRVPGSGTCATQFPSMN